MKERKAHERKIDKNERWKRTLEKKKNMNRERKGNVRIMRPDLMKKKKS